MGITDGALLCVRGKYLQVIWLAGHVAVACLQVHDAHRFHVGLDQSPSTVLRGPAPGRIGILPSGWARVMRKWPGGGEGIKWADWSLEGCRIDILHCILSPLAAQLGLHWAAQTSTSYIGGNKHLQQTEFIVRSRK